MREALLPQTNNRCEQVGINLVPHIIGLSYFGDESFQSIIFYCATLCLSAVFAVGRCLSVTFVYCIQTAEDIVKHLVRPGSRMILAF